METLRDGPKGPYGPERLQANTHLLQITDLDYKTLSKDYKKAVKKPQIGLQHLNKLYIDMETLRDGPKNPYGPERLQANTHLLQIHWPGLQDTEQRLQKAVKKPQIGLQHLQ